MKTEMRVLIQWAILQAAVCGTLGAEPPEQKPNFENDIGWSWHVKPRPFRLHGLFAMNNVVVDTYELKGDQLLLTLARSPQSVKNVVRFRPVAFDRSGQRFVFNPGNGGSYSDRNGSVEFNGFVLDLKTVTLDQIKWVGIERLTQDSLRDVVAPAAFEKLKEAGVNALPFPRLGERYEFELTAIGGKKISSRDLQGKVVLLDFWAKWCMPCMEKMPKLKEAYQKLHKDGFEVVGLNHDRSIEEAKRTIAQLELPWPNVFAPPDKDQMALWFTATGTGPLPRLLLIDRDGILRAEPSTLTLSAEIEQIVGVGKSQ